MEEVSLREYVDQRFDDSDKAISAAMVAQEKAILKAETAAEERFKLLNELRQGVATKEQLEALEKVVLDGKARLDSLQGRSSGLSSGWAYLLGFISLVSTLLAIWSFI
jgi:hypothetical protein